MSDQGELSLSPLNAAKKLAFEHCSDAVTYLVTVMNDEEESAELRVTAAAELIQFATRAPY